MITHYDMITGEVIGTESHHESPAVAQLPLDIPAPSLMTVEEAVELERASRRSASARRPVPVPMPLQD